MVFESMDDFNTLKRHMDGLWSFGLKSRINRIYDSGSSTCDIASNEVFNYINRVYPVDSIVRQNLILVGGEYNRQAHYWVETKVLTSDSKEISVIIDLGNNIKYAELNEPIKPVIITPKSSEWRNYANRDEFYNQGV